MRIVEIVGLAWLALNVIVIMYFVVLGIVAEIAWQRRQSKATYIREWPLG